MFSEWCHTVLTAQSFQSTPWRGNIGATHIYLRGQTGKKLETVLPQVGNAGEHNPPQLVVCLRHAERKALLARQWIPRGWDAQHLSIRSVDFSYLLCGFEKVEEVLSVFFFFFFNFEGKDTLFNCPWLWWVLTNLKTLMQFDSKQTVLANRVWRIQSKHIQKLKVKLNFIFFPTVKIAIRFSFYSYSCFHFSKIERIIRLYCLIPKCNLIIHTWKRLLS